MATVAITPGQNIITGEIFVAAPPARVFQALTDPAQMPLWWGASDLYRITEWKGDIRVGGKWSSDGVGVDGKFYAEADAKVSVFDHGLLYGDGIFEGIRFYNGRVFRLEEHLDRLWDSARSICYRSMCCQQRVPLHKGRSRPSQGKAFAAAAQGPLGERGRCRGERIRHNRL